MEGVMGVRAEAYDWLEEASEDLRHAKASLEAGSYNWACFAAQQAAEKALKAFMIGFLRRRPPHVHDLTMLYEEVRGMLDLPENAREGLGELSAYYVLARYPNAGLRRPSKSIGRVQAERAIAVSEGVVQAVKRRFESS